MKMSSVTLDDIARKAQVAKSTVSLALRCDPRVSRKTRLRIERCAKELKYKPNPLVGIYQSHVKSHKAPSYQATLAFVTYHSKSHISEANHPDGLLFLGACKRASELGYRIEHFQIQSNDESSSRKNHSRLQRILRNRGICGIVFGPAKNAETAYHIDLADFSAVATDYSIRSPKVHRVCHDYFNNFCTLFARLEARGYKKIALAMPRRADARVSHYWISAFYGCQHHLKQEIKIPPLLPPFEEWNKNNFQSWYSCYRPEVVISVGYYNFSILNWLSEIGLRVPDDIGFSTLIYHPLLPHCSGMDVQFEKIGAVAVEQLTGLLHRNERGETEDPHIHLLEGSWSEGKTLQKVSTRSEGISSQVTNAYVNQQ